MSIWRIALITLHGFAAAISLLAQPTFETTWLGSFSGVSVSGVVSTPTGINSSGAVVGWAYNSSGVRQGFLYSNGSISYVGNSDSQSSIVYEEINDAGMLVGSNGTRAIVRSGSTVTVLGTLGGSNGSGATAVNNSGQLTGYAWLTGNSEQNAFVYSNGTMLGLGSLNSSYGSWGWDINDSGQVVGESYVTGSTPHAFLYSGGTMQDLTPGYLRATGAYAINSLGQAVGYAYTAGGMNAVLFENNSFTTLANLGAALDINDSGQIVGYSRTSQGNRAFFYYGGTTYDLNTLAPLAEGWTLTNAIAINNSGQIAATAAFGGIEYAVVLTPIPEPATVGIALGLIALGAVAYRRRQKLVV